MQTKLLDNVLKILFWLSIIFCLFEFIHFGVSDNVRGMLIYLNNGAHVNSIFLTILAFYFIQTSRVNKALYLLPLLFVFFASDSKQIVASLLGAYLLTLLIQGGVMEKIKRGFYFSLLIVLFFVVKEHVVSSYGAWLVYDLLESGFTQKLSVFNILYNEANGFNVFFGFGPGNTCSRLSMTIAETPFLSNLGLQESPLYQKIWNAHQDNTFSNSVTGSSVFSLFFSISAILGDLGVVGFCTYFFMWIYIYVHYTVEFIEKFLLNILFILSFLFLWIGEPHFSVILAIIVARFFIKRTNDAHTSNT
ncbi:hypothetical protein OAJ65_01690 [Flavobacteriales bacterium]|nr:hypothetical protein [Flavobacteriales bacterium]